MSDHATDADPLDLESLDPDSLFAALTNVERAIPDLLGCVKPVLAHLTSESASHTESDEASALAAREAVERYMVTLDKIQFILRQTVYYLRETKAPPNALLPASIDNLPRPLAATLRPAALGSAGGAGTGSGGNGDVELGLYASRAEVEALTEMRDALRALRQQTNQSS